MRTVGTGLSSGQVAEVKASVLGLIQAEGVRTAVTVKNTDSDAYTPSSGAYVVTTTDNLVDGFVSTLDERQVGEYPSAQIGDLRVCIAFEDLTILPTKDTALSFDTHTHSVVSLATDPLSIYHEFIVRRST